jgi:hypothetical protein
MHTRVPAVFAVVPLSKVQQARKTACLGFNWVPSMNKHSGTLNLRRIHGMKVYDHRIFEIKLCMFEE